MTRLKLNSGQAATVTVTEAITRQMCVTVGPDPERFPRFKFPFPPFPIWPGNGEGIPGPFPGDHDDSAGIGDRESPVNRFGRRPGDGGNGKRGPDWPHIIGKSGIPSGCGCASQFSKTRFLIPKVGR